MSRHRGAANYHLTDRVWWSIMFVGLMLWGALLIFDVVSGIIVLAIMAVLWLVVGIPSIIKWVK